MFLFYVFRFSLFCFRFVAPTCGYTIHYGLLITAHTEDLKHLTYCLQWNKHIRIVLMAVADESNFAIVTVSYIL
jgi:hypothetical protein